ncbi:MAG TPA: FxDxF family PEP-CTERM protein [Nitrosospira sp.]
MNNLSKSIIGALVFTGTVTTATAAGVITNVTASGAGLGSVSGAGLGPVGIVITPTKLDLSTIFDHAEPITLTFTVTHTTGSGGPYVVTDSIKNNTGLNLNDFNFTISEPATGGQGVVFTSHNHATLTGFTLDSNSSDPRHLNLTGTLANHDTATSTFNLSVPDPGARQTATFALILNPGAPVPVTSVPEPETYAMLMAGLGVIGFMVRRRRTGQNV